MYDTISLTANKEDFPSIDFLNELPQYLDRITNQGESFNGQYFNGNIQNFKISINQYRLKLHGASLARFINGENQTGMTLKQTKLAIHSLSDQLQLDLGKAKVTRIDVGRNIITKYNPSFYFPFLGDCSGYKRQEAGDGLYYKNSIRLLTFYDKIKEQKAKRQEIIHLFEGKNLFRYELRLASHLERELKKKNIIGENLYNEDFYIQLGLLWRDQYMKINKKPNESSIIPATTSTRDLVTALAAIAIQNIGDSRMLDMVSEWQHSGLVNKHQASNHRRMIRETIKKEFNDKGNSFIEELDKKIKEATRYFI